jgi:hypothetical protein
MKFRKTAATLLVASSLAFPCMSYAQSDVTQIQPTAYNDSMIVALSESDGETSDKSGLVNGIQVQLNGSDISFSDAKPVIEDGHVYVPFRAVFEALKADVAYDEATGVITAERDGKTVSLKSGSKEISVDDNGTSTESEIDTAVFNKSGYTYVPVRTISEAYGCGVGWDSYNETVVIVDKDLYSAAISGNYTYADKLYSFIADVNSKDKAIDCNLDIVTGFKNEDGTDASITVNGKMTGTQTADASKLSVALSTTGKNLDELMDETGDDSDSKDILDALKKSNLELVLDSKNEVFYIKGELISALLDVPDGTWVTLSKEDLESLGVFNNDSLSYFFSPQNKFDFKNTISQVISVVPLDDSETAKTLFATLNSMLGLYKDSSFKKTASGYSSTSTFDLTDGMEMKNTLNIKADSSDNISGYDVDSVIDISGLTSINMNGSYSADKSTMTISMDMPEIISLKLNLDENYTYGTQKAITIPSGKTISILDAAQDALN